jgi:DNA-binding GntR family transcriptional regulator
MPRNTADRAMPLETTKSPFSLTDVLTSKLREEILSARLVPNGRLRFQELRETYHASVGALREALSRLAADSLVELQSRRGFRVAPVSVDTSPWSRRRSIGTPISRAGC